MFWSSSQNVRVQRKIMMFFLVRFSPDCLWEMCRENKKKKKLTEKTHWCLSILRLVSFACETYTYEIMSSVEELRLHTQHSSEQRNKTKTYTPHEKKRRRRFTCMMLTGSNHKIFYLDLKCMQDGPCHFKQNTNNGYERVLQSSLTNLFFFLRFFACFSIILLLVASARHGCLRIKRALRALRSWSHTPNTHSIAVILILFN